jgi:threonine synthase
VAGVKKALEDGIIEPHETVVIDSTGFGLKDTKSAEKATGGVNRVDPDIAEVEALYGTAEEAAADD